MRLGILIILSMWTAITLANPAESHIPELQREAIRHGLNLNYALLVDFSRPASEKRLFLIDLKKKTVLYSGLTSHGSGSGRPEGAYTFSNVNGSLQSSLGCSSTLNKYYGKHGLSLRLRGLDSSNNKNESRAIVVHPADYVGTSGTPGRSWGCITLNPKISRYVINKLGSNSLVMSINR